MSRFKQVPLDYLKWQGSSADELGYAVRKGEYEDILYGGNGLVSERHLVQVPSTQQWVNVFSSDGRPLDSEGERSGPTILKFQSHNYRIDELSERKTQIHAHQMGARVLDIELPGVVMDYHTPDSTRGGYMTPVQFVQAFSGNFDSLSLAQLQAADSLVDFKDRDEVQLYGESLGAYSAVALARALAHGRFNKTLYVSDMTLVEPVNAAGNRSIIDQLKLATERLAKTEHQRRLVYLAENTAIGHPTTMFEMLNDRAAIVDRKLKARIGQNLAATASGAGLRKGLEGALYGALQNTSPDGPRLHEANITFMRGRESTVTMRDDMDELAEAAYAKGTSVRLVELSSPDGIEMPAGHSQLDSLGRMAEAALFMAHRAPVI